MTDLHADAVLAAIDLGDRAGARGIEIAWDCPHQPDAPEDHTACPQTAWTVSAAYQGARIITDPHPTPSGAALAFAERMLSGATCRCRLPVTLSDDKPGCRWRLMGQRWEPGCDAPPLRMPAGSRGDHAAMQRALTEGNRTQRRAARKGRRSR